LLAVVVAALAFGACEAAGPGSPRTVGRVPSADALHKGPALRGWALANGSAALAAQPSVDRFKALFGKRSKHRWVFEVGVGVATMAVLLGVPFGIVARRGRRQRKRLAHAYNTAAQCLREGRHYEALAVIRKHDALIEDDAVRRQWGILELAVLEKTRDLAGLCAIYENWPEPVVEREGVSLAIARAMVQCERFEAFGDLRSLWRGRERRPGVWLTLEFDALLKQDEEIEARDLLEGRRFQGADDAARLVRLGLLRAQDEAEEAEALVAQAARRAPNSPEPRLFHAALQEAQGRHKQALTAYQAALKCDPRDPFLRDHLAEFYRRRGDFGRAMRIWGESLKPPSMDFLWLKTAFWRRVAIPVRFEADAFEPPAGELRPLVDYLRNLNPNVFWDTATFESTLAHRTEFLARQETFWLQLLQAILDGHEVEALSHVNLSGFGLRSWHPPLENALSRILTYRQRGFVGPPPVAPVEKAAQQEEKHPLFAALDRQAESRRYIIAEPLQRLLHTHYIFAAACFAAGWKLAGLRLLRSQQVPPDAPDWLQAAIADALRTVPAGTNGVPAR